MSQEVQNINNEAGEQSKPTEEVVRFLQKADTKAMWKQHSPTLLAKEVGFITDEDDEAIIHLPDGTEETGIVRNAYKIGDGETEWNKLPYATAIDISGRVKTNQVNNRIDNEVLPEITAINDTITTMQNNSFADKTVEVEQDFKYFTTDFNEAQFDDSVGKTIYPLYPLVNNDIDVNKFSKYETYQLHTNYTGIDNVYSIKIKKDNNKLWCYFTEIDEMPNDTDSEYRITLKTRSAIDFGLENDIKAIHSFTTGLNNTITETGEQSVAFGEGNTISGSNKLVSGIGLKSENTTEGATVIGQYNKDYEDALFIIGNGEDEDSRNNALVVTKDGKLIVSAGTIGGGGVGQTSEGENSVTFAESSNDYDTIELPE